mgnify:CR=1 FL=1
MIYEKKEKHKVGCVMLLGVGFSSAIDVETK